MSALGILALLSGLVALGLILTLGALSEFSGPVSELGRIGPAVALGSGLGTLTSGTACLWLSVDSGPWREAHAAITQPLVWSCALFVVGIVLTGLSAIQLIRP